MMIKNRLVLIDSFALIFRAFYGIPASLTKDGHPINAAYGFTSALLAAIKELQPEYLVACFDLPKPTKRKLEYVEYKAHRKPMPDDLVPQIQYCKKVLETMNIPMVAAEGYEGEDIIASILAKIRNPKSECQIEGIIVTGDSDTFQLVDEQTRVYSMARGASQAVLYDTKKVVERYGLTPQQFVDFKALKGDASDNIPGIPGVGEKTASMLIQKFNSLDNLYHEIAKSEIRISKSETNSNGENVKNEAKKLKISPKVLNLLITHKDQAYLSQKLSQIQSDAPIKFDLNTAKIHDFDHAKVTKLFEELSFKSLIPRLHDSHRTNNQLGLF